MKHEIKRDNRDEWLPFTLYCNNQIVATAQYGYILRNQICPNCNKIIEK